MGLRAREAAGQTPFSDHVPLRYVEGVALMASVVAKGMWIYTPALHGELLNGVY